MKSELFILKNCLKRILQDLGSLKKGQKVSYELLQLSHRLEKGLLREDAKPLWGWDKAERMLFLIQHNDDAFSDETALSVLAAYIDNKIQSTNAEDRNKAEEFKKKIPLTEINTTKGGILKLQKHVFSETEQCAISKLFDTRHSIRTFSDKPLSEEVILKAAEMALRCPSACNRQPFKVYVVTPSKIEKEIGHPVQYRATKMLEITGDVRAFTEGELLDWIVSPCIFAAYLTLSLHSLGVGSCVIRKDLIRTCWRN